MSLDLTLHRLLVWNVRYGMQRVEATVAILTSLHVSKEHRLAAHHFRNLGRLCHAVRSDLSTPLRQHRIQLHTGRYFLQRDIHFPHLTLQPSVT